MDEKHAIMYHAILHIQQMTDEEIKSKYPDTTNEDIKIIRKIQKLMNGKTACVAWDNDMRKYWLISADDYYTDKKLFYLYEQNPSGRYRNRWKEFSKAYDSGKYKPDFIPFFSENEVEIICRCNDQIEV
jgi:hypothetical protein